MLSHNYLIAGNTRKERMMKKKIVLLLCMTAIVASISGCKKETTSSGFDTIKENIANELGKATQESINFNEEYTLTCYVGDSSNNIYTIDANGNMLNHYDLKDYQSVFDDLGLSSDEISIAGSYDGILYFYNYSYAEENGKIDFYALDIATNKTEMFFSTSTDWSVSMVDIYNGKCYIDLHEYETSTYQEHVFAKAEDSFSFTEENTEVSEILEKLAGKSVYKSDKNSCFTRSYEKYGFLIAGVLDDEENGLWSYYKVTPDEAIAIDDFQRKKIYIEGYNDKWLYLNDYDDEDTLLVCYDFEEGTKHEISKDKGESILDYDNDKVYYGDSVEKQYGINDYNVYCYDCSKQSTTLLYTKSTIPGTGTTTFGQDGFRIINGQIYAIEFFNNSAAWARYDTDKNVFVDLNLPIKEYGTFKYGTVNYDSKEKQCPYCGLTIYQDYTENFVLDAKYSAHADEINALLAPSFEDVPVDVSETDCKEMHADFPDQSCETDNTNVYDVQIINDRYLAVEMTGYWYGGGAHGMPHDGQRIFDLNTGEELGLYDFFSGSEDEFKALVAEKIKEDYTKNPSPYFAESDQEAYDQACEYTSEGDVFWEDDHITYKFAPYIMGPFASGYITVDIPYTELLGTTTLNRL